MMPIVFLKLRKAPEINLREPLFLLLIHGIWYIINLRRATCYVKQKRGRAPLVWTIKTVKGNYHPIPLTIFAVPTVAFILALVASIIAVVSENVYQSTYKKGYEAIISGQSTVTVNNNRLSVLAINRLAFSTPELFTIDRWSAYKDPEGKTLTFSFIMNNYALDYEGNLKRYNEALDGIVAEAPEFKDKKETVKWIHDYIIENYDYDYSYESYSALSMMDNGVGVCNAYTALFSALCGRFGIEYGVKTTATHTWNVVKLGSVWYHVDVTWDDEGSVPQYEYFLLNDREMLERDRGAAHFGWDDTGISLTQFENVRNILFLLSAAFFIVISTVTVLPTVYIYLKK